MFIVHNGDIFSIPFKNFIFQSLGYDDSLDGKFLAVMSICSLPKVIASLYVFLVLSESYTVALLRNTTMHTSLSDSLCTEVCLQQLSSLVCADIKACVKKHSCLVCTDKSASLCLARRIVCRAVWLSGVADSLPAFSATHHFFTHSRPATHLALDYFAQKILVQEYLCLLSDCMSMCGDVWF